MNGISENGHKYCLFKECLEHVEQIFCEYTNIYLHRILLAPDIFDFLEASIVYQLFVPNPLT